MEDLEALVGYLESKKCAKLSYPFGPEAMVFKVKGKLFAIVSKHQDSESESSIHINLKCDPDEAQALRDIFSAVKPGYHMNKKHWNTVCVPGDVPVGELTRMIDQSYALVVKGLKKSLREALAH